MQINDEHTRTEVWVDRNNLTRRYFYFNIAAASIDGVQPVYVPTVLSQSATLVAGTRYVASAWIATTSWGGSGTCRIDAYVGGRLFGSRTLVPNDGDRESWSQWSAEWTEDMAGEMDVSFVVTTVDSGIYFIYVDDVKVEAISATA